MLKTKNAPHPYRKILRYQICPSFEADRRIDELVQFCLDGRVEEVMVFFNCEELTVGHITLEELTPWLNVGQQMKEALAKINVPISLNPWTTTYHEDRGFELKPNQNFTTMVGETGVASKITACPLCVNWQRYIAEIFAQAAAVLQPVAIWLEDDWRLHNHGSALGFGGCFCELHLQRLADAVGREQITRDEVLDAVLAPGTPHPWRKAWLEISRQSLLEPARIVFDAVRRVSPETKLALMSSDPDVHSIEHRNWEQLAEILRGCADEPFLTRPHLPPYNETTALWTLPTVTRQTLANLPRPLAITPELDNGEPYGLYAKSRRYSLWQMKESLCYGSSGITLNYFDPLGNGIIHEPGFAEELARVNPVLDAISSLELDDTNATGPAVLFSPKAALVHHVQDDEPASLYALCNNSRAWGDMLSILGIAHRWTKEIETGRPIFACDQTLRAFNETQIEQLLSGVLFVDGTAAETLAEMGFAEELGLHHWRWRTQRKENYAYEEILCDDPEVYGIARPRMSAMRAAKTMLEMQVNEKADIRTVIRDGMHRTVGPGTYLHETSFGGVVVASAWPLSQAMGLAETRQPNHGYLSQFRQIFMRRMLQELSQAGTQLATNAGEIPLRVYRTVCGRGTFIGVMNPTLDIANEITLELSDLPIAALDVQILDEQGQWNPAPLTIEPVNKHLHRWSIHKPLTHLDGMYLLASRGSL